MTNLTDFNLSVDDESSPMQFRSRFDENFEIDANNPILGVGGFGIVFKAKDNLDQQYYAVKRIRMPRNSIESRKKVLREVHALAKFDHPNIVGYSTAWEESPPLGWQEKWDQDHEISCKIESSESDTGDLTSQVSTESESADMGSKERLLGENDKSYLQENSSTTSYSNEFRNDNSQDNILDYGSEKQSSFDDLSCSFLYIQNQLCTEGTLTDWLEKHRTRDKKETLKIFYEITCALDYLHNCGLMHRDLKPSNIFLASCHGLTNGDCGLAVKLGDFGLVKDFLRNNTSECQTTGSRWHTNERGTLGYISPEQAGKTGDYDTQTDIYSLGLILLELCQPLGSVSEKSDIFQEAKKGELPRRLCKEFKAEGDLVRKMLSSDPSQRPTASDILEHPLLKEFRPDSILWNYVKNSREKISTNFYLVLIIFVIVFLFIPAAFFMGFFSNDL